MSCEDKECPTCRISALINTIHDECQSKELVIALFLAALEDNLDVAFHVKHQEEEDTLH